MRVTQNTLVVLLVLLVICQGLEVPTAFAATGAPRILNYQGRLMDATGNLLGGSGTNYCFRFSLYDSPIAGTGTKVWPAAAPSTMTIPVKNGVFNAGIGDTGAGGDTLDYNFQDSDTVYLNVDVATMVGPTCAPGDGAEVYETLSPRQRLMSSAYALNSNTVGGFSPAQNASGSQIPVLTSGNLILGGTNPILSATTTNVLTIQGSGTGDVRFFNSSNKIDSLGNITLAGSLFMGNGLATTTLQSGLTGTSTIQGFLNVLGTHSTSTFSGGLSVQSLAVTGVATSTFANGINLSGGCFAVNGVCIDSNDSFATTSADYYVNASSTIPKTYTSNSFTATQTFVNASTTNLSASYASSTQANFGSVIIGALGGIVHATAGVISASALNLATEVTGFLGVTNGGTGTSTAPALGQILVGNASGGYDYVATSTLGVADGNFSTTSATYFADASTTIAKTYASNKFSALQMFTNASSTIFSVANGLSTTTLLSNATSTFAAGVQAAALTIVGAASSTFANGINLAAGCFAINGTCMAGSGQPGNTGTLVNIQTFTASGTTTYIPSPGVTSAQVIVTGGGGGGGTGNGVATLGGSGGAGGTSIVFVDLTATSSVQVTVGGAGASRLGTSINGGNGGNSRFSTFAMAYGGLGGQGGSNGNGGIGGAMGTGSITLAGGMGSKGATALASEGQLGGASYWGGGAAVQATSTVYGAGGGSATSTPSSGAGGGGIVVVYEYGPFTGVQTVANGGTGVSSAPTYGQMLVGDGTGKYVLTATSSLGITGTFSTTSADYYVNASSTIPKTYTSNSFTATQTFVNASTTNLSASYASSTQANFGSVIIGALGGIVHATAGVISASALNLATEVTGFLGVTNGGTGTSTAPALGQILVGNASGGYDYVATSTLGVADGNFSTTSATYFADASTTIAKTYTANTYTAKQTFGNASTTNLSASYASSTQANFGSVIIGALGGIVHATAGVISASALNLATEVTDVLGVGNGGTGWANIAANTLLTGNGTGAIATTTVGGGLQLSGGTLTLNVANANVWSGLQSYANASTSLSSVFTKAYFGGTATTTIDSAGNVSVAGALTVASSTTLATTTATNLTITASSTIASATIGQASSTALYVSSAITGAGLTTCTGSNAKLLWDATTGQFSCGSDVAGVASLGATGQTQTGSSQTFATSTDTNLGLVITSASNIHTFTTIWNGVLSVVRGGTGWANIAANTLLTGNGTGAIATTTVGGGLQLSGGTLTLNVANANVWSGLQQFGNASTTLFESINQFARTIQSTSTNALVFKTNLTSTQGLTLGGTSTPQMVSLDTQNNRVTVGTGGSATPTVLVADTGNSTDPAGTNGAMYYSSVTNSFRCYENSAWRSCGGQATSTTGDIQFKNADGSFKATSNFNWSLANNGLTVKGSAGQVADLLTVASSTGITMFSISSMGVLELATTTDPVAPPSNQLDIYAASVAGKTMVKTEDATGSTSPMQTGLYGPTIVLFEPSTGTTGTGTGFGTTWTAAGTVTHPTPATTAPAIVNQMHRTRYANVATTQNQTLGVFATAAGLPQFWMGNAVGLGGFFFHSRFSVEAYPAATIRLFVGLTSSSTSMVTADAPLGDFVGLWHDTTDGANVFSIITRNNVTTTKTPITGAILAAGQAYDFYLYEKPNDATVYYRLDSVNTGTTIVDASVTVTLPRNTIFMGPQAVMSNGTANTTVNTSAIGINNIYVESKY